MLYPIAIYNCDYMTDIFTEEKNDKKYHWSIVSINLNYRTAVNVKDTQFFSGPLWIICHG